MSSLHVGVMPNGLGSTLSNIDWVPINLLAGILVELAEYESKSLPSSEELPPNCRNRSRRRPYIPSIEYPSCELDRHPSDSN